MRQTSLELHNHQHKVPTSHAHGYELFLRGNVWEILEDLRKVTSMY